MQPSRYVLIMNYKNACIVINTTPTHYLFIDVGRVINCIKSDSYSQPSTCYDPSFNLLTSFDLSAWEDLFDFIPFPPPSKFNASSFITHDSNKTTLGDLLRFLEDNATIPTQLVLYDLPYYYIGM